MTDNPMDGRYSRQARFKGIGASGQTRISNGRVLVIGCGGLGTALVNLLARSGVGTIVVVDRDFVELSNLQRQLLFDEADAEAGTPKAVAAAAACSRINSEITVVPVVADVSADNIESMVEQADLVIDATDNLQTRYLLNDACVKAGVPWIYGGAVAANGMTMTVIPGETACLRCLWSVLPAAGATATCATVGVLGAAVVVIAALQWTEAIKLLVGDRASLSRTLRYLDLWSNDFEQGQAVAPVPDCPCCGQRQFEFLDAKSGGEVLSLCGRDAVQVRPASARKLDLAALAQRLDSAGSVAVTGFMLRLDADGHQLTVFPDGRAIIKGTSDTGVARSLYSQYIGD